MKIVRVAYNATDIEKLHDHMKSALRNLNLNFVGKSKIDIRRAIKKLEQIRPHLKNRGIR